MESFWLWFGLTLGCGAAFFAVAVVLSCRWDWMKDNSTGGK